MKNSEIYKAVTDEIVKKMEQGIVPWQKPWTGVAPANLITKKLYRGVNHLILSMAPYSSSYWLTYNQAKKIGGHVKKGEKSTLIVFWKFIHKDIENEDGEVRRETIPLLRYYRVFNVEQCELPEGKVPTLKNTFKSIEAAERIVENMPQKPKVTYGGDSAFYATNLDLVNVPVRQAFEKEEEFYSTMFHELTHAARGGLFMCKGRH